MATRNPFQFQMPADMGDNVKAQAQEIWLAGLGAFSKAQQEGGKMFQTLVDDGVTMQRNAQKAAEAKIAEATEKMTSMAQQFTQQASVLGQKATGQWDRLESIFEERVAKALTRMGVPQAEALAALEARVAALEAQLNAGGKPAAKTAAKTATQTATKSASKTGKKTDTKPVAKTATPRTARSAALVKAVAKKPAAKRSGVATRQR
jgi:poly(hydroxyalkanoate) granule-associated protein